ncbi:hypothetical protein SETIT_1G187600v2 [Setaria italica]|uniref:Uncharacterized protein n=1 Tax=Setaria italica TaxID=4555 RepID=A0A368PM54_SETIT|nr:hypothetical protein SETIT_1G187600v2 [Setaria italica]
MGEKILGPVCIRLFSWCSSLPCTIAPNGAWRPRFCLPCFDPASGFAMRATKRGPWQNLCGAAPRDLDTCDPRPRKQTRP